MAADRPHRRAGRRRRRARPRRPPADRGADVGPLRRQPPHRPPRTGGTGARRHGADRAGPRELHRRGRAGLCDQRPHPLLRVDPRAQQGTGRTHPRSARDRRGCRRRRRRSGSRRARVVRLERLGPRRRAAGQPRQTTISPPRRYPGLVAALGTADDRHRRARPRRRGRLPPPADPRISARMPQGGSARCACRATGRCWSPKAST